MADDPDLKARILAEIAAHVKIYGRSNWDLIRENPAYKHLIGKDVKAGKRKFFRWVDAVCAPLPEHTTDTFDAAQENAAALEDAKKRATLAAHKNLPAAPSPAYLMREGAGAANNIDFLAMLHRLVADVEMFRAKGVKEDEHGQEQVGNFVIFGASIDKRLRIMETGLRVMQEIWDLRYQQRFYDMVTSIIVEELAPFPDVQSRVIDRISELNKRQGMTIYADPA